MGIWQPAPVSAEPTVYLTRWSIWCTELGSLHLVGVRPETQTGRVSSPVASLDVATRTAVTSTGREYRLVGPPGQSTDTIYVWKTWCSLYHVLVSVDLTNDVLACTGYAVKNSTHTISPSGDLASRKKAEREMNACRTSKWGRHR